MAKATSAYTRKRHFESTGEPREPSRRPRSKADALRFVVHKHDARHLHYDFRLELDGTLKSWAIPKGPSLDPTHKRLAVQVEDHPLGYATFEGTIAEGNYGAGDVIVWDQGIWQPEADPAAALQAGKLKFVLVGEKLSGAWTLVRTRLKGSKDKPQWLLIKEQDEVARPGDEYDIVSALPASVISGALVGGRQKPAANQARPKAAKGTRKAATRPAPGKAQQLELVSEPSAAAAPRGNGRETIAGVSVSHPERIIDAQSGITKGGLARFYTQIADWLLPQVRSRPVALLRAPAGVEGEQFFQKHAERLAIPNIRHLDPQLDPGHDRLMAIENVPALIGAVQMGTVELHTWNAGYASIERPDRLVLDLDPDPQLPWRAVVEATRLSLSVLDELGLEVFLKTSGGRGMHLVVPLARHVDWDTLKAFGKALSQFMADELPDRFSARMGPKNRVGKVYLDYLRNGRGASTVAAYSVRARPGLPVSVPIRRDELEQLQGPAHWHVGNLLERLEALASDPWEGYANRQRITRGMWKKLGAEAP